MNIGIVTVYNSPNCGSKLQAYALYKVLSSNCNTVFFLRDNTRSIFKIKGKSFLKNLLLMRPKASIFFLRQIFTYLFSKFHFKNLRKIDFQKMDEIILGSDEIWNVARKEISNYPFFWGDSLTPPKISYAPSINFSTFEDLKRTISKQSFQNIKHISVRDEYSKQIIEKYLNRFIAIVCDPTMLISKERWIEEQAICNEKDEFILVYGNEVQFNKDDIIKIKDFSKREKLPIISSLDYLPFADKNIPLNPEKFLGYMNKAKYVISSTFHGTCFSLIFQKKFVTISRNNPKVIELLKKFEIEELNACDTRSLSDVIALNTPQQIEKRQIILESFRTNSNNWLQEKLLEIV